MNEDECKAFWLWLLNEGEHADGVYSITFVKPWLQRKRDEWRNEKQYDKERQEEKG